jgi:hypothetical protein
VAAAELHLNLIGVGGAPALHNGEMSSGEIGRVVGQSQGGQRRVGERGWQRGANAF